MATYLGSYGPAAFGGKEDNMAYLIKCKHQSNVELPEEHPVVMTNFTR